MLDASFSNIGLSAQDHVDPRPDSIEADRLLIKHTATAVTALMSEMNSAATYIRSGGKFENLHEHLVKNNPKDKTRIGWYRAFSKDENRFGLSRRTAEAHIDIHAAFSDLGNMLPTSKLPQSLRPLHLLATLKLTTEQLVGLVDTGNIGPMSTEGDIRRIGIELGLVERKTKPVKVEVETTKPNLIKVYDAATLEQRWALYSHLTVRGLLQDIPNDMRSELAGRLAAQRARSGDSSSDFTVKCSGLLNVALLNARNGHVNEAVAALNSILRKLTANGRDLNDVFIAIGSETKRKGEAA
jgi:hypothetical protein